MTIGSFDGDGLRSSGDIFLATGRLNLDSDLLWTGCLFGGIVTLLKDWKDGRSLLGTLDIGARSRCGRHIGTDSCDIGD